MKKDTKETTTKTNKKLTRTELSRLHKMIEAVITKDEGAILVIAPKGADGYSAQVYVREMTRMDLVSIVSESLEIDVTSLALASLLT